MTKRQAPQPYPYRRGDHVHLLHPGEVYDSPRKARPSLCGWVSVRPDEPPTPSNDLPTCMRCIKTALRWDDK